MQRTKGTLRRRSTQGQRPQGPDPAPAAAQRHHLDAVGVLAQHLERAVRNRLVRQASQVYGGPVGKIPEYLERADAIPLVQGVGDAVDQVQEAGANARLQGQRVGTWDAAYAGWSSGTTPLLTTAAS